MSTAGELKLKIEELRNLPQRRLELVAALIRLVELEYRNSIVNAVCHAKEALALAREAGGHGAVASSLYAYGTAYQANGDLDAAMMSYQKSLKLWQMLGNSLEIAKTYSNIGHVYKQQNQFAEAEDSYEEALAVYRELEDDIGIAGCHGNLGLVKSKLGASMLALEEHKKAFAIRLEFNDLRGVSDSCYNIGFVLNGQNLFSEARNYFLKSLKLKEDIHDERGISISCSSIGTTYIKENRFEEAFNYANRGLINAINTDDNNLKASCLFQLSRFCETAGNFKQALEYMKKYQKTKENIFDTERKHRRIDSLIQMNTELQNSSALKEETELLEQRSELENCVQMCSAGNTPRTNYNILEKSFKGAISIISKIVEMRDPYYQGHHLRTAELARSIAREMKLAEDKIQAIYFASIVYGIGRIKIPQEFLSRSGKLSDIELRVIRTYPQTGYNILKSIEFPWPIADIVLQHHEFVDGSGYPCGLTGDEIMEEARVLCVADTVEAMSSRRPYRPPFKIESTVEELNRKRGILYDNHSVDACISVIDQGLFTPREDTVSV
jgi:HD-GYP domain-containing protein (c-di-GMP phosphodiesterase class II)